ncbi:hypothetical protein JCM11251_000163 [Rhodosporidiobolus azoricus]
MQVSSLIYFDTLADQQLVDYLVTAATEQDVLFVMFWLKRLRKRQVENVEKLKDSRRKLSAIEAVGREPHTLLRLTILRLLLLSKASTPLEGLANLELSQWAQAVAATWGKSGRTEATDAAYLLALEEDEVVADWVDHHLPPPPASEALTGYNPLPPLRPVSFALPVPTQTLPAHRQIPPVKQTSSLKAAHSHPPAKDMPASGTEPIGPASKPKTPGQAFFFEVPSHAAWFKLENSLFRTPLRGHTLRVEREPSMPTAQLAPYRPKVVLDDESGQSFSVEEVIHLANSMLDGLDLGGGRKIKARWAFVKRAKDAIDSGESIPTPPPLQLSSQQALPPPASTGKRLSAKRRQARAKKLSNLPFATADWASGSDGSQRSSTGDVVDEFGRVKRFKQG